MEHQPLKRKDFLAAVGKGGACFCAAAAGMKIALAGPAQTPPPVSKPGDKTPQRAVKRLEFIDGWVPRFFGVLDQTLDEPSRARLMTANGRACFAAFAGPAKKKPEPDALAKFKAWIGQKGRDQGYGLDGDVVTFEFVGSAETGQASPENICLCPLAEAQKAGQISPTYCLCSVGYVAEMHERALGRPVKVELVESVLRGGKRCKFRLTAA